MKSWLFFLCLGFVWYRYICGRWVRCFGRCSKPDLFSYFIHLQLGNCLLVMPYRSATDCTEDYNLSWISRHRDKEECTIFQGLHDKCLGTFPAIGIHVTHWSIWLYSYKWCPISLPSWESARLFLAAINPVSRLTQRLMGGQHFCMKNPIGRIPAIHSRKSTVRLLSVASRMEVLKDDRTEKAYRPIPTASDGNIYTRKP